MVWADHGVEVRPLSPVGPPHPLRWTTRGDEMTVLLRGGQAGFSTKRGFRLPILNGSAFSTYMGVAESDFLLIDGEAHLKEYKVENTGEKYFCSECGSPVFNKNYRVPGLYMVFYGAFSQPANFPPSFNVYCSTKHQWVDDIKNMKSFEESIRR